MVDAVSWAVEEYGQVAVIEEDVLPGPDFLPYLEFMLDAYRDDPRVDHISAYNVVPLGALLPHHMNRLTIYPESIAWATWERAWSRYDDELRWLDKPRLKELTEITGVAPGGVAVEAKFRRRSCRPHLDLGVPVGGEHVVAWRVEPESQRQPGEYVGHDEGTHRPLQPRGANSPFYTGPRDALLRRDAERDEHADAWLTRTAFRGTMSGVLRGMAVSAILAVRRRSRARRAATRR